MKEIQAIFLDFDGIVLESVDVKGWAFGKLFENYPKHTDTIVAYHHAHGGVPRFDKFRYIYKELLKEPLSEEKFQELCHRYSELVFQRVLACDFVKGALEFLKKYHMMFPLFVVTGTPQEEIERVVQAKELVPYFKGVFGSPDTKGHWTKKILGEYKLDPKKTFWIGDAMSDLRAAQENGVPFIGRILSNQDIFAKENICLKIRNLFELDQFLSEEELSERVK